MKTYLAGPTFSKMDIRQRKEEVELLRNIFKEQIEFVSILESDSNNEEVISNSMKIYEKSSDDIYSFKIFIFDLNNMSDIRTFTELGMAIERKERKEDILIIGTLWDSRKFRNFQGEYDKEYWGFNEYPAGALKQNGFIVEDIKGAIPLIKEFIKGKEE